MRTFPIIAALTLVLAIPDLAVAQGNAMQNRSTSTKAPVGHRQPEAKDAPRDQSTSNDNDPNKTTEADRALDRALRAICRGC